MAKKVFTGTVVSDKMMKTVVVNVVRQVVHPLYKKRMKLSKKYSADTNGLDLMVGDLVKIEETRPISKTKYFKVIEKIGEDVVAKMASANRGEEEEVVENEVGKEAAKKEKKTAKKGTKDENGGKE